LSLTVFVNGEGLAIQIGDDMLLVVDHRRMQQNFVDVFLEDEDTFIACFLARTFWFWIVLRWCGVALGRRFCCGLGRRVLRPGRKRSLRSGADHKRDKKRKNPRGPIPQARNIPSWHTPVEAAVLSAAAASLLSYAICRRARPWRDDRPEHIDCAVRRRSWWQRRPGRWDCRW